MTSTRRIDANVTISEYDDELETSTSTTYCMSAKDEAELNRMLVIAGLVKSEAEDIDEQAMYDYGKGRLNKRGKRFPLSPYSYEGTAREPVRYTPARMADNPLKEWRRGRY